MPKLPVNIFGRTLILALISFSALDAFSQEAFADDHALWWDFAPKPDSFSSDALLDLRSLNEKEAGQSGPLRAQGDQLVLGNGQPVRLWGLVSGQNNTPHDKIEIMARRYAKLGINAVRLVVGMDPVRQGGGKLQLDPALLDQCFYTESAFKKQGIYTYIFGYDPVRVKVTTADGVPEGGATNLTYGEPNFLELYKSWTRTFLTTKNPYTGLTLGEDPAFAVYEIQNESSIFFYGQPTKLPAEIRREVERKFAGWLTKKYGSLMSGFAAWPSDKTPDDDASHQLVGLYDIAEFSDAEEGHVRGDHLKRLSDEAHFLADLQRDFYANMKAYIKNELGAKCLVSASNWTTSPGLGFIERYTYTGADLIDKHGYFALPLIGPRSGYLLMAGDVYMDGSMLLAPTLAPFLYTFYPGFPHLITEVAWNKPNRYIAEAAPILSAYASLSGVNGLFNFAARDGGWGNFEGPNAPAYHLWTYMWPGEIGQSPAEALQYRRGDLKPSPIVVRQKTTLDDLFAFKSSNLIEGFNADVHEAKVNQAADTGEYSGFDPLTYFVGRVERTLDSSAPSVDVDLSKYIDRANRKVTSITGEEVLDYGHGLLTINSPRSQAVTGFLSKAGAIKLGDITITSTNEFGTIHVISLDDQPLSSSKRILVQAFTEERLTGQNYSSGRVIALGHEPIQVRNIEATVAFAQPVTQGTVLDVQGYARDPARIKDGILTLPPDALYTIVTR